jgi:transposase-like protein
MFFEKSYYANVIYLSLLQGLMDTFDTVYPGVEHRFCIRHLHVNCKKKGWKGRAFKDELSGAARATNESDFKRHLNVIKGMSQEAFDYLEKIDPESWSRHAFGTNAKTDMISNNIAESFNSWIKDARDKPLITMLEIIRRQLMNRYHTKREGASQATNGICPKIQKKLERSKDLQRNYICEWRDGAAFEVENCYGSRRVVNIETMTCSCGR